MTYLVSSLTPVTLIRTTSLLKGPSLPAAVVHVAVVIVAVVSVAVVIVAVLTVVVPVTVDLVTLVVAVCVTVLPVTVAVLDVAVSVDVSVAVTVVAVVLEVVVWVVAVWEVVVWVVVVVVMQQGSAHMSLQSDEMVPTPPSWSPQIKPAMARLSHEMEKPAQVPFQRYSEHPSGLVMAEDSGSARSATRTRRRAGAMAAGPPRIRVSLIWLFWIRPRLSEHLVFHRLDYEGARHLIRIWNIELDVRHMPVHVIESILDVFRS